MRVSKLRLYFILGYVTVNMSAGVAFAEDATQKTIDKILAPGEANFDLSLVTLENHDQIISRLREQPDQLAYTILLLQLGDPLTIDRILERYQKFDSRDALLEAPFIIQRAKQPLLIPRLAADLYLPEGHSQTPSPKSGEDVIYLLSRPASSADMILETIIRSPCFSHDLKGWAKKFQRGLASEIPRFS